jgi:cell fate regulator YaaT (PSP1 superfamily)
MAKDQNLPLTPTKISGACGRLMCCLAYELSDYKELMRGVPKPGSKIKCFGGQHRIEKINLFNESVLLTDEDHNLVEVPIDKFRQEIGVCEVIETGEDELPDEELMKDYVEDDEDKD